MKGESCPVRDSRKVPRVRAGAGGELKLSGEVRPERGDLLGVGVLLTGPRDPWRVLSR